VENETMDVRIMHRKFGRDFETETALGKPPAREELVADEIET